LRRYGGWRLHCLCEEVRRRAYYVGGRSLPTESFLVPSIRAHDGRPAWDWEAFMRQWQIRWWYGVRRKWERKASTRQNEKRRRPARGREVFPTERRYQSCARTSPLRRGGCSLPVGGTGAPYSTCVYREREVQQKGVQRGRGRGAAIASSINVQWLLVQR
jgi:hypothetical protein